MAIILEVLDRRTEEVRVRMRLETFPMSVGRGYGNDLVLDDPYMDARHAQIARDEKGGLVMQDLGSLNGLVSSDTAVRAGRVAVRPGIEVRIGRTRLRFRDADEPVPMALLDIPDRASRSPAPIRWLRSPLGRQATWIAAATVTGLYTWLGNYDRSGLSESLSAVLAFALVAGVWAAMWGLASRMTVRRFHFNQHFAVISAAALILVVLAALGEWGGFFLPDNKLVSGADTVLRLGVVAVLIATHLGYTMTAPWRRRLVLGVVVCGVAAALMGALALAERDSFSDVPEFAGVLKPFPGDWMPAGTIESFGKAAEDLKAEVDGIVSED
jgi:hypothetical protein